MPNTSFGFDDATKRRIEALLVGTESISQFAYNATIEKCNRMEKRNEDARRAVFSRDVAMFKPVIKQALREIEAERE